MTRDFAQVILDVTIGFEADVDRVIAILGEETTSMAGVAEWKDAFLGVPEVLGVDRIGDSGVVVRVTAKVRPVERWRVQREALRRIKKRLDLEEIVLPWNPVRFYRKDDGGAGDTTQ
jgi:small conductance mechanosensitive channel